MGAIKLMDNYAKNMLKYVWCLKNECLMIRTTSWEFNRLSYTGIALKCKLLLLRSSNSSILKSHCYKSYQIRALSRASRKTGETTLG